MADIQSESTLISRTPNAVVVPNPKKMLSSIAISSLGTKGFTGPCSLKRKRPLTVEIPNVLREIQVENELFGFRESEPVKEDAVCFSDSGFAVYSLKGKKKFMEDAYKIASCPLSQKKFFGVYDGHGGSKAADFVVENLHSNIFSNLQNSSGIGQKEEAIKAGFLKTDQDFLNMGLGSGACCVTALIEENKELIVSNIGDCRAVLCRKEKVESLTTDHRAGDDNERRRIEEKGGFVQYHRGAWRVHGVLAVSRSIGDSHLKDWVLAEPDIKIINLTQDMEFLVLASDGLWEEVSNEEAAEVVRRCSSADEKTRIIADTNQKENIVSTTPSPKLRRVLIKSRKTGQFTSGGSMNTDRKYSSEDGDTFGNENDVPPPSKSRRISTKDKSKTTNNNAYNNNNQENDVAVCGKTPVSSNGLVDACKELTNLAVSRGSLDDITVMVIDLNAFKNSV